MKKLKQTKAVTSVPSTMCIHNSSVLNSGMGVFSLTVYEVGSLFGPMDGEVLTEEEFYHRGNNSYKWEVRSCQE